MAGGAVLDPLDADFLFAAEGRFLEGQIQRRADVFAPHGGVGASPAAACAAAEEGAENVAQIVEAAEPAEACAAAEAGAACVGVEVRIHAGKAVLVIAGTLVTVGQNLIGLADLLEFFLRSLVAGVAVRMVF